MPWYLELLFCCTNILPCINFFFCFGHWHTFLRRPWAFSRALGCGARRGARLYTTTQVWVPGGLRGACSRRSMSRNLQVIAGSLSAELGPSKSMPNPHVSFFALTNHATRQNNTRFNLSPFLRRRTPLCVYGHRLCVCVLCMCYVVCGCAGLVCASMCWNPTFQLVLFCSAACCCCCCCY